MMDSTLKGFGDVGDQLKLFVAEKRRRETESSLASMTDEDYLNVFRSLVKKE